MKLSKVLSRDTKTKEKPLPNLGVITQEVRVTKAMLRTIVFRKALFGCALALLGLVIIYIGFAATLVRYTYTNNGVLLIQNNNFHGQNLPKNVEVLITNRNFTENIAGDVKETLIPQNGTAVVRVEAGPNGVISWNRPILKVNGRIISRTDSTSPGNKYLIGEYIGTCIKGPCVPGQPIFFSQNSVMGVLVNPINNHHQG